MGAFRSPTSPARITSATITWALWLVALTSSFAQTNTNPITRAMVVEVGKVLGLEFSDSKIDLMLPGLKEQLDQYEALRRFPLSNSVCPALLFNPIPVGFKFDTARK